MAKVLKGFWVGSKKMEVGDTVSKSDFPEGQYKRLVEDEYLEESSTTTKKEDKKE